MEIELKKFLQNKHVSAFLLAFVASMGTFLGGIIVVLFAKFTPFTNTEARTNNLIGILQAFSAGVMVLAI